MEDCMTTAGFNGISGNDFDPKLPNTLLTQWTPNFFFSNYSIEIFPKSLKIVRHCCWHRCRGRYFWSWN